MSNKSWWTIVMLGLAAACFFLFPSLLTAFMGMTLIIAALVPWAWPILSTPPWSEDKTDKSDNKPDARWQQISNMLLGLGIGLIAGVALLLLPPTWFWPAMGMGLVVIILFWFLGRR